MITAYAHDWPSGLEGAPHLLQGWQEHPAGDLGFGEWALFLHERRFPRSDTPGSSWLTPWLAWK